MSSVSMAMLSLEYNNSNGSDTNSDMRLGPPIFLIVSSAVNLLSLLLLLPYIPVLRAAWKLPKSDMLPWIVLNLFLIAINTLGRSNVNLIKAISDSRLGHNEWMLSISSYCRSLLWSLTLSFVANNITPLVLALIEVVCLRRPGLASKQWLFNCVGSVGIWVVSLGMGVPFLFFTYRNAITCTETEYDYQYVIGVVNIFFYALAVYAVFLFYMTLSRQLIWKPSQIIAMEAMICALSLYNILITTTATVVVVSPSLSEILSSIAVGILGLVDLILNLSGLIIFCRYKEAQRLAKAMLPCCWRKCSVQPQN
uniref:Uncharacterized protein 29 n=1 Tax=Halisarca dujardinii TaxID=2583056 RepID=A0AA96S0G1_HALDU|nr:uncharacterized protein 29 [Halisarca dujardinii]